MSSPSSSANPHVTLILQEVERLFPRFVDAQPALYFALKRLEYMDCLRRNDYPQAMKIAREDLGNSGVVVCEVGWGWMGVV